MTDCPISDCKLTENDITRVSYMLASMVATPERSIHFIDRLLRNGTPDYLGRALNTMRREIVAKMGESWASTMTLCEVAAVMIADADRETQSVGRLLCHTLGL